MAVSSASSWTNTTDVIASAVPCRLKSVKVRLNPESTAASYLQLFNSADATPGSTAPDMVTYIPAASTAGRDAELNINYGGVFFATGLTWFVATASAGGTAPTTNAPLLVDVHYTPVL